VSPALVRVSSDKQEAYRQIETLTGFIDRHGLTAGKDDWYEDVRSRMEDYKAEAFHYRFQPLNFTIDSNTMNSMSGSVGAVKDTG
jgi:hypothetical protein